jgi:hypothetical protein
MVSWLSDTELDALLNAPDRRTEPDDATMPCSCLPPRPGCGSPNSSASTAATLRATSSCSAVQSSDRVRALLKPRRGWSPREASDGETCPTSTVRRPLARSIARVPAGPRQLQRCGEPQRGSATNPRRTREPDENSRLIAAVSATAIVAGIVLIVRPNGSLRRGVVSAGRSTAARTALGAAP